MAGETCTEHGLPVALCLACAPRREATVEEMTDYLQKSIAERLATSSQAEWFALPGLGAPLSPFLRNTEETRARLMESVREELARHLPTASPFVPIEFESLPPQPGRTLANMQFTARLSGVINYMPSSITYMGSIDEGDERDIAYDAREEGRYPTLGEIDRPRRWRETHPITGLRADRLIVDDPYTGDDRVDALTYAYRQILGGHGES